MTTKPLSLALVGQPNVGKSTVFNMLTGLNQHVGNWPGKTVEQRTGTIEHDGLTGELIDLPGAYCLTASSPEESVTRDWIIHHRPDVVIAVINASSLERNLYLVSELLALPAPLVLGLNMMDVAAQEGYQIEPDVLAAAIGIPVVPMIAAKGEGVHELIDAALHVARNGPARDPNRPAIRADHAKILDAVNALIQGNVPEPYPVDWVALKLLEGDQEITDMMRQALGANEWDALQTILHEHEDAIVAVAGGRYAWISRMTRAALQRPRAGRVTRTQRIDQIATHPFWGLVLLAGVLAVIFGLTYSVGGPMQEWLAASVVDELAQSIQSNMTNSPAWLVGVLADGILGGAGTVLTFVPILLIFFLCMAILEDVGYMARAAYVMDRFMHAVGLHGKSFMPLFLGFGCTVPAIMGARIIESRRSRLLTILLAPLVPCTARLSVLAVLVPMLFPKSPGLVSWALTGLPLVVLAIAGVIINKFLLKGEQAAFIMEMPLYHLPNRRTIGLAVWQRLVAFVQKAGTVILAMSIAIWALTMFPSGDIETSYMAAAGRFIEPVGQLMGLGWRPLVAVLTSFVAKENAVATLGVVYGVGESATSLKPILAAEFTAASGLAFLVVEMLFIPCISTLAVIKQETGTWRWVLVDVAFLAAISLLGGIAAYQIGILLF